MTPQYVLRKSLCRPPFCAGPQQYHDKPLADWPAPAVETWRQTAENYIENMDYATEYGEPGYDNPKRGILFSDWNYFPKGVGDLLEKQGFAIEWEDEWCRCDGCQKALRCSPDSYSWQKSYIESDCNRYCFDCMDADDIAEYIDNPHRAVPGGVDLLKLGFVEIECGFESGWHPGQNDNPEKITADLKGAGYSDIIFQISESSQFYIGFCVWTQGVWE